MGTDGKGTEERQEKIEGPVEDEGTVTGAEAQEHAGTVEGSVPTGAGERVRRKAAETRDEESKGGDKPRGA